MQDKTKYNKDLVLKRFLYAVSSMVLLTLLFVFSVSLFSGDKLDETENVEILETAKLKLAKLSDGSVSMANLDNEELFNSNLVPLLKRRPGIANLKLLLAVYLYPTVSIL